MAKSAVKSIENSPTRARFHPVMVIASSVIWVLLWGKLSLFLILTGALIGVLIGLVFPLPVIPGAGRIRPLGLLRLIFFLIVDLVRSSVSVAITVLRFGYQPKNAILGVQLRTRSDLYLTATADLVSLVPGTLVVEARRTTGTLYIHVLDVSGDEELRRSRKIVLDAEAAVIRAFGTAEEVAALKSGAEMPTAVEHREDR